MTRESDIQRLKDMTEGTPEYFNWFEEGGAEIQFYHGLYLLYEVPMYGGQPFYVGPYKHNELDKMLDLIYTWT